MRRKESKRARTFKYRRFSFLLVHWRTKVQRKFRPSAFKILADDIANLCCHWLKYLHRTPSYYCRAPESCKETKCPGIDFI